MVKFSGLNPKFDWFRRFIGPYIEVLTTWGYPWPVHFYEYRKNFPEILDYLFSTIGTNKLG
jgi:hypothetical protein